MKAASALRAAGAALRGGARSIGGAPKVRFPFLFLPQASQETAFAARWLG